MVDFEDSYLGRLREFVGNRLIIVAGNRAIIENEQGHILLMLRNDFKVWGLPAGSVEIGESSEISIRREILEETGLTAIVLSPIGFASDPEHETITYPNGDKIQNYSTLWHVTAWEGELQHDDEAEALQFFDPNQMPKSTPNTLRSIQSFLKYKQTGEFQLF
jgi:ADP-ribose pyrophosphatase YjhB (NUDIX family)